MLAGQLNFGQMLGAGLLTPPKRPTEGLSEWTTTRDRMETCGQTV